MIELVGAPSAVRFVGAYSPDQARDEQGRWTDGYTVSAEIPAYTGQELSDRISKIQDAPVSQIEATESRLDEQTVKSLMEAMKAGEPIPAIVTEFSYEIDDKDILSVLDGHHRLEAAKRLGLTRVPVRVRVASEDWSKVKKAGGFAIRGAASNDSPSRYRLSKFAAEHAAELVKSPRKVRDAIRNEVRKALRNGEGPDGIADRLFEQIDMEPFEIQRIAETEYVIARTGARLEQFDREAGDDLDARKRWMLGIGEEGCPICAGLAGQEVPLGEAFDGEFDGPPAHPNCRCDVELVEEAEARAAEIVLVGAEFDESKHPRDERGRWTDGASVLFEVPEDFKLEDAQYDVNTRFPREHMVVAEVDVDLIPSPYPTDWRNQQMAEAMQKGAKFPPITLEQYPDRLVILDGNTRLAALRDLGFKGKIPAVIRLYGDDSPLPKGVIVDKKTYDEFAPK